MLRWTLFFVVIFILFGFGFYAFVKKEPKFMNFLYPQSKTENYKIGELMWEINKDVYGDIPNAKTIFMLGMGYQEFDDKVKWNFQDTPFLAEIVNANENNLSLTVRFKGPKSMPSLGQEREIKMTDCNEQNSFLELENPRQVGGINNFFFYAKPTFDLVSFCVDIACSQAGIICKLYRPAP